MGKSGPNATFNLIFRGLGWPWVGEFVGFIIVFTYIFFLTQHNLVNRKHPINHHSGPYYNDNEAERDRGRFLPLAQKRLFIPGCVQGAII